MASDANAARRPGATQRRIAPWSVLVVPAVAAGVMFGVLPLLVGRFRAVPAGLPDSGPVTWWALPAARLVFDVAAVGTIGTLLAASVLVAAEGGRLPPAARRLAAGSSRWAVAWAAAALTVWLFTLSDLAGAPAAALLSGGMVGQYGWSLQQTRAPLAAAAAAGLVAIAARRVRSSVAARSLLGLGILGLVPVLLTGHAAGTGDHELASGSVVLHVVAASLWVGGLLALVVHLRRSGAVLAVALPRFSVVAGCCFVAVAISGAVGGYARLRLSAESWTSSYGAVLGAKSAVLLALGIVGWRHRTATIPQVLAGRPRAFARLAMVELVVMAVALGLAVALARTPFPAAAADLSTHGTAHRLLGYELGSLTPEQLLTQWRPDALVLSLAVLGATAYVTSVRRVRQTGVPWPGARTVCALAAVVVAALALCSGVAAYSRAVLSVQVAQFQLLLLVVPALLSLAQPVRLARTMRSVAGDPAASVGRPPGRAGLAWADPVNGLLLVLAVLVGLYAGPLLSPSLRLPIVHLGVNLAAVGVGFMLFRSVLGTDRNAVVVRAPKDRALLLLALSGVQLVFAAVLRGSETTYGGAWFAELGWEWSDPMVDQRLASSIVVSAALGLALLAGLVASAQGVHHGLRTRTSAGRTGRRDMRR